MTNSPILYLYLVTARGCFYFSTAIWISKLIRFYLGAYLALDPWTTSFSSIFVTISGNTINFARFDSLISFGSVRFPDKQTNLFLYRTEAIALDLVKLTSLFTTVYCGIYINLWLYSPWVIGFKFFSHFSYRSSLCCTGSTYLYLNDFIFRADLKYRTLR